MCDFLPQPKNFNYNWSTWKDLIEEVHLEFAKQFVQDVCSFAEKQIKIDFTLEEGKERTFWHLVTRDIERHKGGERTAEVERTVRAHWARPIIENFKHECIRYWKYLHNGKSIRHYFWAEKLNYLVILEEKPNSFFLVTGYMVDKEYMKKTLEKQYAQRIPE